MKKTFYLLLCMTVLNISAFGQTTGAAPPPQQPQQPAYRVYDSGGNSSGTAAIVGAMAAADVIFLGESHDDAVAHAVQAEIFKDLVDRYAEKRRIALSLEMFERDVQTQLDEYLQGLIPENHFLSSTRPWGNYKTDYRPLVELAKEKKLPVIAANAPRRYVNMVSRNGRESLATLSPQAKTWIAPLPYEKSSDAYRQKFEALMGGSGEANKLGLSKIVDSQALWDATMAYSISEYLKNNKGALVVHLNGSFHTESRLGTPEHLLRYYPKARFIVVTMKYEADFNNFDKTKHTGLGDFVILTDAKQPRSGK